MKEIYGKLVCETLEDVLEPRRCAVLAIDIQNDFMKPDGLLDRAGRDIAPMLAVLPRCAAFLEEARALGIPVVHVRMVTLPNGTSDSPAMLRAKQMMSGTDFCLEGTWGAEFCEECAPLPGEIVVEKHRSSAFVGTRLDQILRANGVDTVVIVGEQTPGCVEATYRDASYFDYYNVLVEDCVAAFDPELHEASLKIQRARHDVTTADEVLAIWRRARARDAEPALA
jgi:nicotinamidase-related amidase